MTYKKGERVKKMQKKSMYFEVTWKKGNIPRWFSAVSLSPKHAHSNLNDVFLKYAAAWIQEAMQAMTLTNEDLPTTNLVSHSLRIKTHMEAHIPIWLLILPSPSMQLFLSVYSLQDSVTIQGQLSSLQ